MEELLKTMTVSDIFIGGFILGMIFNMINDVILSLIDYIREKAWRVSDYEALFYDFQSTFTKTCYLSDEGKELYYNAINNHKERLEKREKLDKFLSKFRRK